MESSTPAADRDAHLLGIGKQCSHDHCMLIDFLPFKCHHCQNSFCQEHFKVEAHQCSQYDETKHNRVAPNCPMCNTPVAIKPGQDPNARMEEHFSIECTAMNGRGVAKSTPTCGKGNCKKVLYTPIKCDKCRKDFCASHRFPADHNCSAASTAKVPAPSRNGATHPIVARYLALSSARAGTAAGKRLATSSKSGTSKASTTGSPATNSNTGTSEASNPATNSSAGTSKVLSVPSPFNKTDRLPAVASSTKLTTTNITTSDDTAIEPNNPYIPRQLFSTA